MTSALDVTLELDNLILSGELPREAFLLDGLLIGLEKPGGGVRPIAISETWYRFAGVCALRTYGRGIGERLAPLQVGVGTPGVTETVAHALASALAENPETVVISVDMANAFNSIHRAAMLAAVHQLCCRWCSWFRYCSLSRCSQCWSRLMQRVRKHRLCPTWTT